MSALPPGGFEPTIPLQPVLLESGEHDERSDGLCVMEYVALLAGEEHTATPACVSPTIRTAAVCLNDECSDWCRQQLAQLAPQFIGSVSKEHELVRTNHFLMQIVKTYGPTLLCEAGLTSESKALGSFTCPEEAEEYLSQYKTYTGKLDWAYNALLYRDETDALLIGIELFDEKHALAVLKQALALGPTGPSTLTAKMQNRLLTYQSEFMAAA